jgi:transcriptional regulator with XRE-family HTH domain
MTDGSGSNGLDKPRSGKPAPAGSIGSKMRIARMMAGLRQGDLANRMEISQVTVSSWETGRTHPNALQLERFASVLGMDLVIEFRSRQ